MPPAYERRIAAIEDIGMKEMSLAELNPTKHGAMYIEVSKDCNNLRENVKKPTEALKKLIDPIEAKTIWSTTKDAWEYRKIARQALNRNMDRFS